MAEQTTEPHTASELHADDADTEDKAYSRSRLVIRSNWFVLLTRRRKKSSSTQNTVVADWGADAPPLPSCSHNSDESREDTLLPPGSSDGSAKQLKIVKAFNRFLRIRSKKSRSHSALTDGVPPSQDSPQLDAAIQPTTTSNAQIHGGGAIPAPESPPSSLDGSQATTSNAPLAARTAEPPVAAAASNMYCTDAADDTLRTALANRSTTAWLCSLSPAEATVYRARIAANPMGWYRGAMTRERAQQKLQAQPNGSFLVRDSQTAGCHFTLSFRSAGITLHYRIECANGFWVIESYRNVSLVGLIEHAQQLSRDQILCYVKPSSQLQQPFPVRLTHAISKRREVPSLQHVCRFVIRRHLVLADDDSGSGGDDKLDGCLPDKLQAFVREKAFLGQHIGYFET